MFGTMHFVVLANGEPVYRGERSGELTDEMEIDIPPGNLFQHSPILNNITVRVRVSPTAGVASTRGHD